MKTAVSLFSLIALFAACDATECFADELPPVSHRFEKTTDEVPDFQRHLVPLLGKLGCNGRACHGSFQGQGDFRLSLFGYDFKMDHDGLSERVETDSPTDSYALEKATLATDHEGGKRMEKGSWEYNVFLGWIKGGARPVAEEAPSLVKLHVTPKEIVFYGSMAQSQLKAVAEWSDGTMEDVTPLCRYQSNDTQVANITATGLVTAGEPGDTHVVAFYDTAVIPIPVIRPVSEQTGDAYPQVAATTRVDELVVEKLSKLGIVPSEQSEDAEFLRRVTLDLAGTLPTPDEVREFLSDDSSDKRQRKVEELLATPAYAAWWTNKLCDYTGNSDQNLVNVSPGNVAGKEWYEWMHKRVADNVPYDEIVEGMVLATSRQGDEDYRTYSERRSSWYHKGGENGFADEPSLAHYWSRRNFRSPEDRAVGFAYTFLGIRIQCAQCHKHPFDQWTQSDFEQFQGFFARTSFSTSGADRSEYQEMLKELGADKVKGGEQRRKLQDLLKEGETVPFPEVFNQPSRVGASERKKAAAAKKQGKKYTPKAEEAKLLGGDVVNVGALEDPREPLMEWLRLRDNRLFARAFVNRVWASYFNRGIVEPTDDLSLANPPSNEALLTYLADGFIESGYDMKWVHRTIVNSDTYQRSWQPNETNEHDERNFSRAIPRRIPAEVAYDAIQMATLGDERTQSYLHDLDDRAIALSSVPRGNARYRGEYYALAIFGKSIRENNCDCERSAEPSLLQTIYLRNDEDLLAQIDRPKNGWLSDIAKEVGLKFDSKASQSQRPANYDETVARFKQQISQYRKRKGSEKSVAKVEKRLSEYQAKYGAETSADAGESGQSNLADKQVRQVVEEAYLRTLSRHPTEDEFQTAMAYIGDSKDEIDGVRGLLWTLLNTKEFIVNH